MGISDSKVGDCSGTRGGRRSEKRGPVKSSSLEIACMVVLTLELERLRNGSKLLPSGSTVWTDRTVSLYSVEHRGSIRCSPLDRPTTKQILELLPFLVSSTFRVSS